MFHQSTRTRKKIEACNHCISRFFQEDWIVCLQWFSATIALRLHNNSKAEFPKQFGNLEIASVQEILKGSKWIFLHMDASAAGVSFMVSVLA